ncbi:Adenosine/AMP deaminase domain-containing protein [Toxoplasma gondii GT1]|uniref:Adenosine/AMP deaminase domain-containing protein n=7 Tax=Toxoplasma gondii TaxID=5811 RepID=S7UQZ7_TOXGG|nr:Adenosine/AMP deaminase domain-containing protein [Toxoplasma gondii GT1]KAF4639988.1 Adenosine/AMP deaminase domain-containing protein [Toxoplasma gondii]KFG52830.1 Adenosine/AMP deaminase domain-containing protein [Toxoplasma gondii FOU]KFH08005.1 Adenosine/AMP deaminase domain-containing protein [Toxoplasma gondii VAND]KFH16503.1 Adenosine/AMP deaminase domain-containing protein [Toxoplasma gondii MAS]PUA86331.1 Adenosine/AMP deaminase domain-containing protein [Toxoplasma gondii TgCATBr
MTTHVALESSPWKNAAVAPNGVANAARLSAPVYENGRSSTTNVDFLWRADCCCCCGHGVPVDLLLEYAHKIPKVELHVHMEGTLEATLAKEIAKKNGVPMGSAGEEAFNDDENGIAFGDLDSFLAAYFHRESVLRHREDIYNVVLRYFEKSAAQNVRHIELLFDFQSPFRQTPPRDALQGMYDACLEAEKRWGVTSRRILCFIRSFPLKKHLECVEMVTPYMSLFDGFGLAASELGHENYKFRKVFDLVKQKGFPCVAHAGEEGPAQNVIDALLHNHAARIDHGTSAVEDPGLLKHLVANQVPLTVCPLSNVCLGVCRNLEEHPLLRCMPKCSLESETPNGVSHEVFQSQRDRLRCEQLDKLKAADKDPKCALGVPDPVPYVAGQPAAEAISLGPKRVTGSRIGVQFESLIDQGLQVTINSDDPAFFGGGMNENFRGIIETCRVKENACTGMAADDSNGGTPLLKESLHWRLDTIKTVVLNSVYAAFLPLEKKQALAQEVESFDAEFRKKHRIAT